MKEYKNPVCRGSLLFGSNCGHCERCLEGKPDGHVHTIPVGPTQPKHDENENCWCQPELSLDHTQQGGKKVFLHKEIQ